MRRARLVRKICFNFMILTLVFILINGNISLAEPVSILNTSENGTKYISFLSEDGVVSEPVLFTDEDGFWYPGHTKIKSFYLKNMSGFSCKLNGITLNIKSVQNSKTGVSVDPGVYEEFMKNMWTSIKDPVTSLCHNSFEELEKTNGSIENSVIIPPGKDMKFDVAISMDEDAGNNLQNVKSKFDIIIKLSSIGEVSTESQLSNSNHNYRAFKPITPNIPEEFIAPTETITSTKTKVIFFNNDNAPNTVEKITEDISNIPKTGSEVDTTVLVIIGLIFSGFGGGLVIKKR